MEMIKAPLENYEHITIKGSKDQYPRLFENKVKCLMDGGGLSQPEAELLAEQILIDGIELELLYEPKYGLFAVESEAVEVDICTSPYSGIKIVSE